MTTPAAEPAERETLIARVRDGIDRANRSLRNGDDMEMVVHDLASAARALEELEALDGTPKAKAPRVVRACVEVDIDGNPS